MNIKSFKAAVAIPAHRLVKFGSNAGEVTLATSGTDNVIGVSDDVDTDAGNIIDICVCGLRKVQYGGTVTQGDNLTAGAGGKAVKATSSESATDNVFGQALASATSDEIDYMVIK